MRGNPHIVGVRTEPAEDGFGDSGIEWHIRNVGGADYATLCGLDGDDPVAGQYGVVASKRGQRINCSQCYSAWKGFKELTLRETNFSYEVK